jgi:hypothetical protein
MERSSLGGGRRKSKGPKRASFEGEEGEGSGVLSRVLDRVLSRGQRAESMVGGGRGLEARRLRGSEAQAEANTSWQVGKLTG